MVNGPLYLPPKEEDKKASVKVDNYAN